MRSPCETFDNGVVVYQATDETVDKSNIYCEFPWCPPNAQCFVYMRQAPEAVNPVEYVACEFGSWETRVIGRGTGAFMSDGRFYFQRVNAHGHAEIVRVDLEREQSAVIPLPESLPAGAGVLISPNERYGVFSRTLSYAPQCFGVGLVDLHTEHCEIIHTDPYICNQHLQFEPGAGKLLMVQHNRGCRYLPDGWREVLVGPEGCTLFLLEIPSGNVIRLQVGPPYTASVSGHETWRGTSKEILLTLNLQDDYDLGKGPIVGVRPGEAARVYCAPLQLNHLGVEPSGRIFCGDAADPDAVVIGAVQTNRVTTVCPARASYRRAEERGAWQDSHPHAYISPDRHWVVFNSDRTGVQQIYCAEIPIEMIEALEAE